MLVLILATALLAQTPPQQPPPRDAQPAQAAATGVIRGRVVAGANQMPLHRVRLALNGPGQNLPSGVTDTRGEFEITGIPPGTYTLTAARAGYLTVQYGQRRPREAGRPIVIAAGQSVEKIEFALMRGGVLAGRVLDDAGEAAPGVRVEATELRYIRGQRVPIAARIVSTNDVGEYRLAGLEPGMYQLRASSRDAWQSDDGEVTHVFATTYFPGVSAIDQAQTLNVNPGQEHAGLDIRLVPGRAAQITGVVHDSGGAPVAGLIVNLDEISRTTGGALLGAGLGGSVRTNERGEFRFGPLVPGEYNAYAGGPGETTSMSVVVNAGDTKHLTLTPARTPAVAGSVVTDDGSRLPFSPAQVMVDPVDTSPDMLLAPWASPRAQSPRPDWTFRIVNMNGHYLFRVTRLPEEWRLKSVVLGGRDVTDAPLPIARGGADVEGLQLVLTKASGRVEGTVLDRAGNPSPDATVILFADSPALWGIASRFVKSGRPDREGKFTLSAMPPGVYRIIAREYVADGQWEATDFLQSLLRDAARVELAEGATESVTLTIAEAR